LAKLLFGAAQLERAYAPPVGRHAADMLAQHRS